jgi:hypothetical protein
MTEEQDFQEEAERFSVLDVASQREVVAHYRAGSQSRLVAKAERERLRKLADALERLLGL